MLIFQDNPILGAGYGAYTEAYERQINRYEIYYMGVPSVRQPHNSFLSILSETGIFGIASFSILFITIILSAYYVFKNSLDAIQVNYGLFIVSICLAYLISSLGLDVIHRITYINKLFFGFIGVLSGIVTANKLGLVNE